MDELCERLARLTPLRTRTKTEFLSDPYLRDIVERNLEVAAQRCINICHRIITLEGAQKPRSYYEAILRMGELGVLPPDFAGQLAPLAGLRNILVHEYLQIDWDEVYASLARLDDLSRFADFVRSWLQHRRAINP
ncbi:type VII toxin-antitoxin system HepT family RNase toxin [Chloroflexus aurantiacus]